MNHLIPPHKLSCLCSKQSFLSAFCSLSPCATQTSFPSTTKVAVSSVCCLRLSFFLSFLPFPLQCISVKIALIVRVCKCAFLFEDEQTSSIEDYSCYFKTASDGGSNLWWLEFFVVILFIEKFWIFAIFLYLHFYIILRFWFWFLYF